MNFLEEKIVREGKVLEGDILSVGSFLNVMMDPSFMKKIGEAFYERFQDEEITKIVTIEASGIAIASFTAMAFGKPFVFAKKKQAKNLSKETYTSIVHSYTYDKDYTIAIAKEYIDENDKVLIVDDFLANGMAISGLIDILTQAHARIVGIGICVEKDFQEGGKKLRKSGYRVESLAKIASLSSQTIQFVK